MSRLGKFGLALVVVAQGVVFAQEKSVEDSYLQQPIEMMIIREQANTNDRESKILALEYVRQSLENGDSNVELRNVLHDLALEGTLNKVREEGRNASNNFPDIRIKAVAYLGQIKTEEAANSLVKVILIDPEPSVVAEAINSLKKIGLNSNDETVEAICYVFNRYDSRMPNNIVAYSVVGALDAFTKSGSKNPIIFKTLLSISTSANYTKLVRDSATQKLAQFHK
ncbi:MAG: HEAT repeat domain-containing protein [Spirochaetaceae bacterium]|jgi:hypothetical protein|nr:HEAT repeat domain-containing protein [Spirochaetaceae bacterium]